MRLMNIGTMEIVLIVVAILLLFGGKKIPELMNGIGKGVKSFKDGMNGLENSTTEKKSTTEANDKGKE